MYSIFKKLQSFFHHHVSNHLQSCFLCDQYMISTSHDLKGTQEIQQQAIRQMRVIQQVTQQQATQQNNDTIHLCKSCKQLVFQATHTQVELPLSYLPFNLHTFDTMNHYAASPSDQYVVKNPLLFSTMSIFRYHGPLHLHLHHSKYQGDRYLYHQLMSLSLQSYALKQFLEQLPPTIDLIPIPFRPSHLYYRGFSTAYELAHFYHKNFPHLSFAPTKLKRIRSTRAQTQLNRSQRIQEQHLSLRAQGVMHKDVLFIDDVCTTQASLHEAARACLAAGATSVQAITLFA